MGLCNEKPMNDNMEYFQSLISLETIPIVSIEEAIQPLRSFLPTIGNYLQMVKEKRLHPADGLTSDQSAAIMLYSIIWKPLDQCLYILLNSTLQTFDRTTLQPWLLYLKLLFPALIHLPSNHIIVYRGSKSNLIEEYRRKDIHLWWELSLCTNSIEDLQSDEDLRTIFTIECKTVKNIYQHCYSNQLYQLLVLLPATKFRVMECLFQEKENLCLIKLQEIEGSFLLHSEKGNCRKEKSWNIFRRFCLSENELPLAHDHYRNHSLEQRIINSEHSWTVDLDKQNLTDRDMNIVVKYAIIKYHCKRIRLRDNDITPQGCSILAEGLYHNTTLESLDLRKNSISDMGVQVLSFAIIYSNINTLNLESNEITPQGAEYLAQMLKENRTVAELYLSKNHLGDRGVELLAKALSDQRTNLQGQTNRGINHSILQHLYLGQNDITDQGLKHLSNMLKTNQTLTWLWLTGNEISNDGIEYLSKILVDYNLTLEWLFLNSNKLINDSSVDDLIHMLQRNYTLKTLYLNNCNLSEITKRKLLKTIQTKKDFDLEV